jgi:hypoxia up-regulated 1
MFGSDAYALIGRKPESSFAKVFRMLGRSADHPLVQEIPKQYFPYSIYANESTGITHLKIDDTHYTPEELVAMMLQHVKDMTQAFGGHSIKDCVITVPSSFTQHEREALYTAAEIADLKVLSLIEENTAAALHYGIDNIFETPQTVLYYNMGAGSVQVSIVTYSSYSAKEAGKNTPIGQFEVVGKAWDASLGGFNFDVRLADILAGRFNELWQKKKSGAGKDVREFVRPMTRLRLEANKIKEVLSANSEYPIRAEQLHADVDLVTKITRTEFEEACSDLFDRLTGPIESALAMANMSLHDIQAVELLGGAVRMPKVKKVLDEYFAPAKLHAGQHLNGDEAMALGAAFRAANISTAFRVRKVGMTDVSSFGVSVRLESIPESDEKKGGLFSSLFGSSATKEEVKEGEEPVWSKFTSLYPKKSVYASKTKTVAFQHDQDIACQLEYDKNENSFLPEGTDSIIGRYQISGIAKFAKEHADKGVSPKVHLSFVLDSSGRVELTKAEATIELPVASEEPETATANATQATETADANSTSTEINSTAKSVPAKKKAVSNILRRVLTVESVTSATHPPRWTVAQIAESKARLRALQATDDARKAKAAAMNDLETYLYKVKNRIADDESALAAISTEEQRQEVVDLANAAEEWLYDDGRDATVAQYQDKQKEIRLKAESIFHRFEELSARDEAVTKARKSLEDMKRAINSWAEKLPHITEEEKATVLASIDIANKWLEDKLEEQAKASPYATPVFASKEVAGHVKPVIIEFDRLLKKPKPAPVIPEKNATSEEEEADEEKKESEPEVIKVKVESAEDKKQDNTKQEEKKDATKEDL